MSTIKINTYISRSLNPVKTYTEVSIQPGIGIHLVGVQDIAVKEILLRVCTALQSLGYRIPGKKIVINIKTEDGLPVESDASNLDLAVAIGILAASGQISITQEQLDRFALVGEVGLDASLREIRNAYCIALRDGNVILPKDNAVKIYNNPGITGRHNVFVASNISDIPGIIAEPEKYAIENLDVRQKPVPEQDCEEFFRELDSNTRRALEICAAGGHNINLTCREDSDNLIKCIHALLPTMNKEEAIEVGKIYDRTNKPFVPVRPVRLPFSGSTLPSIIGGGAHTILPGEVSLAHNGILVLKDLDEWPSSVLCALRGVKDDRKVTISRLRQRTEYPANFLLVGTMKPCPCGRNEKDCTCTQRQKENYTNNVLDKTVGLFDIFCKAGYSKKDDISNVALKDIRERVVKAREIQAERYKSEGISIKTNGELLGSLIDKYCNSPATGKALENIKICNKSLSAGALNRVKRVARTIADLEGEKVIQARHVLEAITFTNRI